MDHTFQSPNVISFCPGNLGIETGLERLVGRINVMAYVEIEAYIIANLVAAMESGVLGPAPIWTDAKTFDASPFHKKIHWIIGGYPCPGESLAGLREGHLYKGFLWPAIRRAIKATKPICCFFENVDDHLTGTYPIVQRSLRNMGYAVEAGIYSAEEVGAPHERKRLFIFAMADGYRNELRGRFAKVSSSAKKNEGTAWKQNWQRLWDELSNGGQAVADPDGIRSRTGRKSAGRKKGSNPAGGGKGPELAHATGSGQPQFGNDGEPIEAGHAGISVPGTEVGHAGSVGQQGHVYDGERFTGQDEPQQWGEIDGADSEVTRWPAGQGTFQYPWEEPRTIEPGLGCTINGYNFKEDLLRSLGNMVVPDTAEKAFVNLFFKLIQ